MSNLFQPKELTTANTKSLHASRARSHALNSTTETASIRDEHRCIRSMEGVATPGPNFDVAAAGRAKEGGCRESFSRVDVRTITEVGYWHYEPMLLSFKY